MAGAGPAAAQGLPPWRSSNPMVASRSALGFVPVADSLAGWRFGFAFDYANMIEMNLRKRAEMTVDLEMPRLEIALARSVGRKVQVAVAVPVLAAYGGVLDNAVQAWHDFFGFQEHQRESRVPGQFDYFVVFPDGQIVNEPSTGMFLGDVRLTAAVQPARGWQATFTIALPTSTGPEGLGLSTAGVAATTGYRSRPLGRLTVEGSAGIGYTPRSGELSGYQETLFIGGSGGATFRFWGQQSVYANVWAHSPVYSGTTMNALDQADLSLDFGFLLKVGGGPVITAGMVEDIYAYGPGVDMVFRLGARW
jgi:hypothetical protein